MTYQFVCLLACLYLQYIIDRTRPSGPPICNLKNHTLRLWVQRLLRVPSQCYWKSARNGQCQSSDGPMNIYKCLKVDKLNQTWKCENNKDASCWMMLEIKQNDNYYKLTNIAETTRLCIKGKNQLTRWTKLIFTVKRSLAFPLPSKISIAKLSIRPTIIIINGICVYLQVESRSCRTWGQGQLKKHNNLLRFKGSMTRERAMTRISNHLKMGSSWHAVVDPLSYRYQMHQNKNATIKYGEWYCSLNTLCKTVLNINNIDIWCLREINVSHFVETYTFKMYQFKNNT